MPKVYLILVNMKIINICRPFLVDEVLRISYVVAKHDNNFQKITGNSYKNSFTEDSLGWSSSCRCLKEDNKNLNKPKTKLVRDFRSKTIHEKRDLDRNKKLYRNLSTTL